MISSNQKVENHRFEITQLKTKTEYKNFIQQSLTTVLYVLVNSDNIEADLNILNERFSEAIQELNNFKADFAVLICKEAKVALCSKKTENFFQTFDDGSKLLEFMSADIFDYNSLLAHTLQLVLLEKVPIVQSSEELEKIQNFSPDKDSVLVYLSKIGTFDHLLFLKAAYEFIDKPLRFIATTTPSVVYKLQDSDRSSTQLYFFQCIHKDCVESRVFLSLQYLSSFCQRVLDDHEMNYLDTKDSLHETMTPYDPSMYHILLIYSSDVGEQKAQISQLGKALEERFYGQVTLYVHDSSKRTVYDFGLEIDDSNFPKPCLVFPGDDVEYDKLCFNDQFDHDDAFLECIGFIKEVYLKIHKYDDLEQKLQRRPETDEDKLAKEVVTEDDPIMLELKELEKTDPIDKSSLLVLTRKTFYELKQESDFLVVLFFLEVDVRSKASLRHYSKAAKQMKYRKLAIIDCYDWTYTCRDEKITSYPQIRIYRNQKEIQYKGSLTEEAILQAVYMYGIKSPMRLTTREEVDEFAMGQLHKFSHICVLGIFNSDNSPYVEEYKSLAIEYEKNILFAFIIENNNEISKVFNTQSPAVIVFNRNDGWRKRMIINRYDIDGSLKKFMIKNFRDAVQEITITNFPVLRYEKKPFLILFTRNEKAKYDNEKFKALGDISFSNKVDEIIISWMDTNQKLSQKILSAYLNGSKEEFDQDSSYLFYVDFNKQFVYRYTSAVKEDPLIEWLGKVRQELIEPYYTMTNKTWLPLHPGFDYLSMIFKEKRQELSQTLESINSKNQDINYDEMQQEVAHQNNLEEISHKHTEL
ncbi:DgyrCDS689 [Dimorphilus gyrociliatus]|uniref:DgyrCDS689 n=1 Tax=Dimorphilus gyrociliatus TaxID=2664684 RepID=A0A7I8V773_9ANNE|nr:DgyrCDS689 [Dimorphilus gyrociliatus]